MRAGGSNIPLQMREVQRPMPTSRLAAALLAQQASGERQPFDVIFGQGFRDGGGEGDFSNQMYA